MIKTLASKDSIYYKWWYVQQRRKDRSGNVPPDVPTVIMGDISEARISSDGWFAEIDLDVMGVVEGFDDFFEGF